MTKHPPKPGARPKLGTGVDVKRVVQAVALLAAGAMLAIWGISRTFTPGPVTRLEPAPAYVDAGPPVPPPQLDAQPTPAPLRAEKPEPATRPAGDRPVAARVPPPPPAPPPPRVQTPRPPGSVIPVAPIRQPAAPREARLPPPELRFETFEEVTDSSIYSARDPDVEPPVVLYPQQLGRLPIGERREEVAYVEVVINEEGRVLQVKATESPQTLDESMVLTMSLSAAKTWRFEPARKDGRAVRYRQVLAVSLR